MLAARANIEQMLEERAAAWSLARLGRVLMVVLLVIGSTGSASARPITSGDAPDPSAQRVTIAQGSSASVGPAPVSAPRGGPLAGTTDRDSGNVTLAPGSGEDSLGGSNAVRSLQRRLSQLGYSVGPIDGRYGRRTEAAVRRFQKDVGLLPDGVAGPLTLAALPVLSPTQPAPTALPVPSSTQTAPTAPRRHRASRPGGSPSVGLLVLLTVLCLVALGSGMWLLHRGRGKRVIVAAPGAGEEPEADHAAGQVPTEVDETSRSELAVARDVESDDSASACVALVDETSGDASEKEPDKAAEPASVDAVTEGRADLAGAEAAYRRAEERGDAAAAVNLGVLLEQNGDLAGAEAAYRRADERGSADGAFNLGSLLAERGYLTAAAAAFRRADERGDTAAAVNLRLLLEEHGDQAGT